MLNYASEYVDTRRPGAVIAIGVLSIVFAVTFFFSASFYTLAAIGLTTAPVRSTSSSVPANFTTASPDGIGEGPRHLLMDRVNQLAPLSPARQVAFEQFLIHQGAELDVRVRTLASADLADRIIVGSSHGEDGADLIDFANGRLTLRDTEAIYEPTGTTRLITVTVDASAPLSHTAQFGTTTMPAVTSTRAMISGSTLLTMGTGGVFNVLLALLLMAAGILTLRTRPIGRRLHLWWAGLKFLGAILSAVGVYLFYDDMMTITSASNGTNAAMATPVSLIMSLLSLGFALLYPIAVLIVMNTRSVKNYLSSVN